MKLINYIFVLSLLSFIYSQPMHYNYQNVGTSTNVFPFAVTAGKMVQWYIGPGTLNQPSPCPPGQQITKVYFFTVGAGTTTFTNLTIKMGQTTDPSLPTAAWYTGALDTVYHRASVTLTSSALSWMSITLDRPFNYDPTQALIIDVNQCGATSTAMTVRQNTIGTRTRSYSGGTSCPFPYGGQDGNIINFGVDVQPASCNYLAGIWTSRPNLTSACYYGSSAWLGDTLYFHAPTTTGAASTTIYRYIWNGSWSTGVPLPVALVGGFMVSAAGKLYYIGGSSTGVTTGGTTVYQYTPSSGTWTTVAPLPVALSGHGAVNWADSVIIVVGGPWTGSNTNLAHHYYNIGTNTWGTTTTSLPSGQGRRSFAIGISGNKIVISSGFNTAFLKSTYVGTIGSNAATITWTAGPDVPTVHTGLSRPGGVAYGNYFFIVCGERGGIGGYYDTTHVYNISTNTWVGILNNTFGGPRSNIWGHVTTRCVSDTLSLCLPGGYNGTAMDAFALTRGGTFVGVINPPSSELPGKFELSQNYPNPFNPVTTISFSLPKISFVTLKVYDVTGREIRTLINEIRGAGKWDVVFDGSDLASGVYFYTLKAEGFEKTNKMMLVK